MNVLYAADNNFVRQLAVSIYSLLKTHGNKKISVFLLNSGISEQNKKIINKLFNGDNHKIFWIVPEFSKRNEVNSDRGSDAQFLRLFFDQYLSKDVKRILYLDCDTLVIDDLFPLYNVDLKEKVAVIAKDAFSYEYRKVMKISKNAEMYNSGVILFDRQKYQQGNYRERCYSVIDTYGKKIIQGDQGILDIVLQKKVKIMEPRYNLVSSYYEFSYAELKKYRHMVNFYNSEEIKNGIKNPAIIHFTSDFLDNRPWFINSEHPYASQWRTIEYRIFGNNSLSVSRSKLKKFFNFLPRNLSISLFGVLQAYIRPMTYRFKNSKLF